LLTPRRYAVSLFSFHARRARRRNSAQRAAAHARKTVRVRTAARARRVLQRREHARRR
jgi:hypothetical protein